MLIGVHDFAGEQRHIFCLEIQVLDQMVVNTIDYIRTILVVSV